MGAPLQSCSAAGTQEVHGEGRAWAQLTFMLVIVFSSLTLVSFRELALFRTAHNFLIVQLTFLTEETSTCELSIKGKSYLLLVWRGLSELSRVRQDQEQSHSDHSEACLNAQYPPPLPLLSLE